MPELRSFFIFFDKKVLLGAIKCERMALVQTKIAEQVFICIISNNCNFETGLVIAGMAGSFSQASLDFAHWNSQQKSILYPASARRRS
jgi:hypothetical protein